MWEISISFKYYEKKKYEKELKKFKQLFLKSEHGLKEAQFFHLYAKKRIIVEKPFTPINDLYEFKFFILNNDIKFIYLLIVQKKHIVFIYDTNYNFLFKEKNVILTPPNLTSLFKKNTLEQLKKYAIKLSEDFPNFIRVDLYLFKEQIFFSELTFTSYNGLYMYKDEKFVHDCMKNFSRVDDYY